MWVRKTYPVVLLSLAVVVLFLTLRVVLRWAIATDDSEETESAQA